MACPLCSSTEPLFFSQDKKRDYFRCLECDLIFADQRYWPSVKEEKRIYDQHQNSPEDLGYRRFLSKLAIPLDSKLEKSSKGLDFGCGSGPTLSVLMEQKGHQMALYDPFYFHFPELLNSSYDFVTSTEVFEHLQRPMEVMELLVGLIPVGGLLGIMTKLSDGVDDFSRWYYKNDVTHICFYSQATFQFLAGHFQLKLFFYGDNAIILQK